MPDTCLADTPCGMTTQQASAEQELADRYAPIVMLKAQKEPCDTSGEAYAPVSVDVVLGEPSVALRNVDSSETVTAPEAADLFGLGEGNYLDFPNSPKNAGCRYEQDFDALVPSVTPVAYAHIAREDGEPGFALQYWLYYYFNDWNNNHESDFEMIQLIFEAGTVEEALTQAPTAVGYSQHGGGEYADWDSDKLQREGDRPIVWVAAGSHSNQFANENYIGRAEEDGVGFGCDDASGASIRMETAAIVVLTTAESADDEFAWINFEGRWGEQLSGEFNGPTGPNTKRAWTQPFGWQEDLRSSNVEVPTGKTAGPSPVNAFCGIVAFVSNNLLTFITERPWLTLIGIVAVVGGLATTAARTNYDLIPVPLRRKRRFGQILRAAVFTVRKRFALFVGISIAFIPAGIVASSLQAFLANNPPLEALLDLSDPPLGIAIVIGATIGLAAFSIAYLVTIVGITAALAELEQGNDITILGAYRAVWARISDLVRARLRAFLVLLLLTISIIGIPWAIRRGVLWIFLEQAILFDGADKNKARELSEQAVDGHWWRAATLSAAFTFGGLSLGPLITAPLLLFTSTPLELLNAISSLIYMIVVPVIAVALALLYFDLKAHEEPNTS